MLFFVGVVVNLIVDDFEEEVECFCCKFEVGVCYVMT